MSWAFLFIKINATQRYSTLKTRQLCVFENATFSYGLYTRPESATFSPQWSRSVIIMTLHHDGVIPQTNPCLVSRTLICTLLTVARTHVIGQVNDGSHHRLAHTAISSCHPYAILETRARQITHGNENDLIKVAQKIIWRW